MVEIKSTDKLQKLIPRLATTHDGEVIATVRAIGRVLESEGLNFHDLAERVAQPALSTPKQERRTWREMVRKILTQKEFLTDWEYEFITSMMQWTDPTPKQLNVIKRIYRKIFG